MPGCQNSGRDSSMSNSSSNSPALFAGGAVDRLTPASVDDKLKMSSSRMASVSSLQSTPTSLPVRGQGQGQGQHHLHHSLPTSLPVKDQGQGQRHLHHSLPTSLPVKGQGHGQRHLRHSLPTSLPVKGQGQGQHHLHHSLPTALPVKGQGQLQGHLTHNVSVWLWSCHSPCAGKPSNTLPGQRSPSQPQSTLLSIGSKT